MASDQAFVEFICDQVREVGEVSHRKMFGEYAIYVRGKVVALVCDDQLFLKPTEGARALLQRPVEAPPFPGAKPYFMVNEHLDDPALLSALFRATEAEVPLPKPRKRRGK